MAVPGVPGVPGTKIARTREGVCYSYIHIVYINNAYTHIINIIILPGTLGTLGTVNINN